MDAARTMTVGAVDSGERPSVISAIVKYNLTERLRILINDAMDIHAGSGISFGPRNVMGLPYMALPISVTVEGANILTRSLIVFGQGAIRCHPYVLKEMESVTEKDQTKALDIFDEAFFGHAGFTLSNSDKGALSRSYRLSHRKFPRRKRQAILPEPLSVIGGFCPYIRCGDAGLRRRAKKKRANIGQVGGCAF